MALPNKLFVRENLDNNDSTFFSADRKYPELVGDNDGGSAVEIGEYKLVRTFKVRQVVEEIS